TIKTVLVRVPVLEIVDVRRVPVHGDQRHPGLNQAARQQTALAEVVVAVALADGRRLGGQVESPLRLGRLQQAEGPLVMTVHLLSRRSSFGLAVQGCLQTDTAAETLGRNLRGQGQGLDRKVWPCRVAVDQERHVALAEKTGALAGNFA